MFTVKQGSSDVPSATMASEARPAVNHHPARQVGNPEPTVVGGSGQLAGRWPNLKATNGDLPVHRCVTDGLGSPLGGPENEWAMVQTRHRPYQCTRDESDISGGVPLGVHPPHPPVVGQEGTGDQTMSSQCNISTVKERQFPPGLCHLTVMWQIAVDNGIWLSAVYIKGETNVIVDSLSRGRGIPWLEWSLCPKVMSQIFGVYGTP